MVGTSHPHPTHGELICSCFWMQIEGDPGGQAPLIVEPEHQDMWARVKEECPEVEDYLTQEEVLHVNW